MDKIKWNGAPTTFDEYRKSVEGHMLQTGLGYMLKKDFQQQYAIQRDKYLTSLEFCEANFVSASQALYDKVYLYGALLSSLSTASKSNRYLSTHDQDKDGITVWMEWVKAYSNKGSTRIQIDELKRNISIACNMLKHAVSSMVCNLMNACSVPVEINSSGVFIPA